MKKLLIVCLSSILFISSFTFSVYAQTTYHNPVSLHSKSIEPRNDVLEWKFKTIDGKLYKRLWNATQGYWVTDWIPA